MNIFERAARGKYRFASNRGDLTTEQLFDLPLTSRNGFNLNEVAILVSGDLENTSAKSFVETSADDAIRSELEAKLDIVKAVIATKQTALAAAQTRADKAEKRRKILEAIDRRQDADLEGKSLEELTKELEALD